MIVKKLTLNSSIGGGGYGQNIDMAGMVAPKSSTGAQDTDASTKAWNKAHVLGNAISNSWYKPEEPKFAEAYEGYGKSQPAEEEPDTKGRYLHFTQIVWKNTSKVGCAVAYCGTSMFSTSYSWLTVCNYASPGTSPISYKFLTSLTFFR